MKKIILIFVLGFITQSAFANTYDRPCFERYREASELFLDAARDFNNGNSDGKEFLGRFWMIETRIAAVRIGCALESDESKRCALLYKKQYKKLRDGVATRALLDGSQTRVKVGVVEAGLLFVDAKCKL